MIPRNEGCAEAPFFVVRSAPASGPNFPLNRGTAQCASSELAVPELQFSKGNARVSASLILNPVYSLLFSVAIGTGAQLLLKAGALRPVLSGVIPNAYVVGGLFAYAVSAVFYIYALRALPLSVAFPTVSLSYVAVAYLAHVIWGEPWGAMQMIALAMIGLGVFLLYRY
jgi:drug/metabolite transporter (DMT)-like permease